MECKRIPSGIDWDELPAAQLLAYREHLKSCPACRQRVFSEAPEQLLFEISDSPLPDDFWLGFWESVENKLDRPELSKRSNRALLFMRWAAVFVIGLVVALYSRD